MLRSFEFLVSGLYSEWEDLLMPSLKPREKAYFQSICDRTATETDVAQSLRELCRFLAEKFSRNVIVFIMLMILAISRKCVLYIPIYDRWG